MGSEVSHRGSPTMNVDLARVQFAFTTINHFFFVPVTIGLAFLVIGFAIWTHVTHTSTFFLNPIELLAVLAAIAAFWLVYEHRDGFAFTATTITIASCILAIFVDLYPNVMVSSTSKAYNLTVSNTASPPYALKAMTVVVVVFLPLVLIYQAWTYYVFRRRVSRSEFAAELPPAGPPQPTAPPDAGHPAPQATRPPS